MRIAIGLGALFLAACGGGAAAAPARSPEPVVVTPAPAPPPVASAAPTPPPVLAPEEPAVAEAAPAKAPKEPAQPTQSEARGKLLTKPSKGVLKVEIGSAPPAVGDRAELLRRIDPSVPFVGGGWLAIADTEVSAVSGKTVTLTVKAEKSSMKVNGKKLDHFTVGVPIILKWPAGS